MLQQLLSGNEPLAFLVGAGISIPSPSNLIPGWEFIKRVVEIIAFNKETEKALLTLSQSERAGLLNKGDFIRFEGLMQVLFENIDPDLEILNCLGACEKPNLNHYVLSSLIKKGHYVFTTNFDVLIESAFLNAADCSVLIEDEDFKKFLKHGEEHRNPLFKLHGSLKRFEGGKWIDSRSSVKATLEAVGKSGENMIFEKGKREVLSTVLKNHHLVVLGYSGYDDFDIGPLLRSIHTKRKIIWINHSSTDKAYSWWDLQSSLKKAGEGFHFNKGEECLYEMGVVQGDTSPRKKENIHLFDADTSKVMGLVQEKHNIQVSDILLKGNFSFDKQAFFDAWGKKHLANACDKAFICGALFQSLEQYNEAIDCYSAAVELNKNHNDENYITTANAHNKAKAHSNIGTCSRARGELENAVKHFGIALNIHEKLGSKEEIANCMMDFSIVCFEMGDWLEALKLLKNALVILKTIGSQKEISQALGNIGNIYLKQGDVKNALKHYHDSLAIDREIGATRAVAGDLSNIGVVYRLTGDLENALKHFNSALHLHREIGSKSGEASALGNIGNVYLDMDDWERAQKHFNMAFQLYRAIQLKSREADALCNIGIVYCKMGNFESALTYLNEAFLIDKNIGSRLGQACDFGNIGNVYREKGDLQTALKYLAYSRDIYREIGSKAGLANTLNNIGNVYYSMGDLENAFKHYTDSLAINKEIGMILEEANQLYNIGTIYTEMNAFDYALKHYEDALKIYNQMGLKRKIADTSDKIGLAYSILGDYNHAFMYQTDALNIYRDLGLKQEEANQLGNIGLGYYVIGDFKKALEYLNNSLDILKKFNLTNGKDDVCAIIEKINSIYHYT